MKNRSCPDKIACWDYNAGNCEGCAVGDLILRQKKSIKRLKSELVRYKRALQLERYKQVLHLLTKAFVELKGYKPFEVSQLAKETTILKFLQQAEAHLKELKGDMK